MIYIENIAAEDKIYDGTNQISLRYDVRLPQGAPEEIREMVIGQAAAAGCDAGIQAVYCCFSLPEDLQSSYVLQPEQTKLEAQIKPRPLSIQLPDGWKLYGTKAVMDQVYLTGQVEVSGFVEDGQGNAVIPEGFLLPQVRLDKNVVERWSPVYEEGKQKIYRNAIVLRYEKNGEITGNPTANYYFDTDPDSGRYRKGSLTVVRAPVEEGKDYDVFGEEGSSFRSGNVLWVRQGTGVYVVPRDGSGYNRGMDFGQLYTGGTLTFTLKKVNEKGKILADSLEGQIQVIVDGQVPQAEIEISGAKEVEGVYYGKPGTAVSFRIPEDGLSGMKAARYFISSENRNVPGRQGKGNWWVDCGDGDTITLKEEGSYQIYVLTEDQTGNQAYARSAPVVIDSAGPVLEVTGVKNQSANSGTVRIGVNCSDPYYEKGSLQIEIRRAGENMGPAEETRRERADGAKVTFSDFPHTLQWDGSYRLTASARDYAGNETRMEVVFSVNRFGSVYDLGEETKAKLEQFYHTAAFPVVFFETNLDDVKTARIFCLKNGTAAVLSEGRDYTVKRMEEGEWKQYCYTVLPQVFEDDGSYEVILTSRDRASNSSDNQAQQKTVRFFIDKTPPECLITGAASGEIFRGEELWLFLEARDNGELDTLKVYLDGEEAAAYGREELEARKGILKWKLNAKTEWQRIQVYVRDLAGNEYWTEELPYYITEAETTAPVEPYRKTEKTAKEKVLEEREKEEKAEKADAKAAPKEKKQEEAAAEKKKEQKEREEKMPGKSERIFWKQAAFPAMLAGGGLIFLAAERREKGRRRGRKKGDRRGNC